MSFWRPTAADIAAAVMRDREKPRRAVHGARGCGTVHLDTGEELVPAQPLEPGTPSQAHRSEPAVREVKTVAELWCTVNANDIPGWEGAVGPFPAQYGRPHVYARDVHSGAGNCVCGWGLEGRLHVQAAPGVPMPGGRHAVRFMKWLMPRFSANAAILRDGREAMARGEAKLAEVDADLQAMKAELVDEVNRLRAEIAAARAYAQQILATSRNAAQTEIAREVIAVLDGTVER